MEMRPRGSERAPRSEERPRAHPLLASSVKSSGSPGRVPGSCVPGLGVKNSAPPSVEGGRGRGTAQTEPFQAAWPAGARHGDTSQKRLAAVC